MVRRRTVDADSIARMRIRANLTFMNLCLNVDPKQQRVKRQLTNWIVDTLTLRDLLAKNARFLKQCQFIKERFVY